MLCSVIGDIMSQIDAIISARTQQRQAEALRLAGAALGALAAHGIPAWLIGSLARGDFRFRTRWKSCR